MNVIPKENFGIPSVINDNIGVWHACTSEEHRYCLP